MLLDQILLGSALVGLCVAIHIVAIMILLNILRHHARGWIDRHFQIGATLVMIVVVVGLLLAHTVEIWIWAVVYMHLGEFSEMTKALYFSTVTFTTLGYGDITLTDHWQFLSSLEAAGGILLFGLSTGMSVAAMMAIAERMGIKVRH